MVNQLSDPRKGDSPKTILDIRHLTKTYGSLTVVKDINFAISSGSSCAIIGPSGSGKTTLLGLCAGLDQPTEGQVLLDGVDLGALDENGRARALHVRGLRAVSGEFCHPLEVCQPRAALARAFINEPKILFADEPTGNLDAETGLLVIDNLFALNAAFGTTLVIVTHDPELAGRTGRVIRLKAGAVVSDT